GSNLRRIEAVTGLNSVALPQRDEHLVADASRLLGVPSADLLDGVQRKLDEVKSLQDELKAMRAKAARGQAAELATMASAGVLVPRVDGIAAPDLRDLAIAVRQQPGIEVVVLAGVTPGGGVSLVAAVTPGFGGEASALIKDAAKAVG